MTMLRSLDDKELIERGIKILFKELGHAEATRFLAMPREMREDSVERHRKWQDGLDKDLFFDEMFSSQEKT